MLKETIQTSYIHFNRANDNVEDIKKFPVDLTIYDDKDNMSLIDILDKLEKLEIIKNADHWINYRMIRNKLTHEYPDNQEEVIEGIKLAIIYFAEISLRPNKG